MHSPITLPSSNSDPMPAATKEDTRGTPSPIATASSSARPSQPSYPAHSPVSPNPHGSPVSPHPHGSPILASSSSPGRRGSSANSSDDLLQSTFGRRSPGSLSLERILAGWRDGGEGNGELKGDGQAGEESGECDDDHDDDDDDDDDDNDDVETTVTLRDRGRSKGKAKANGNGNVKGPGRQKQVARRPRSSSAGERERAGQGWEDVPVSPAGTRRRRLSAGAGGGGGARRRSLSGRGQVLQPSPFPSSSSASPSAAGGTFTSTTTKSTATAFPRILPPATTTTTSQQAGSSLSSATTLPTGSGGPGRSSARRLSFDPSAVSRSALSPAVTAGGARRSLDAAFAYPGTGRSLSSPDATAHRVAISRSESMRTARGQDRHGHRPVHPDVLAARVRHGSGGDGRSDGSASVVVVRSSDTRVSPAEAPPVSVSVPSDLGIAYAHPPAATLVHAPSHSPTSARGRRSSGGPVRAPPSLPSSVLLSGFGFGAGAGGPITPRFRAPALNLSPLVYRSRLARIHHLVFPLLVYAHLPITIFLDYNVLYALVQVAVHPQPQPHPLPLPQGGGGGGGGGELVGAQKAWWVAVAAYAFCLVAWAGGVLVGYEVLWQFARRWKSSRPAILPIYLSSVAFNLTCMKSYALYSFLYRVRLRAGWGDFALETCWYLSQNWPTVLLLLPRAALSLVLLLLFSSASQTLPPVTPRDTAYFHSDDGALTTYAFVILLINTCWAAWRIVVLLVSWTALVCVAGNPCFGHGPTSRAESLRLESQPLSRRRRSAHGQPATLLGEEYDDDPVHGYTYIPDLAALDAWDDVRGEGWTRPWGWRRRAAQRVQDAVDSCTSRPLLARGSSIGSRTGAFARVSGGRFSLDTATSGALARRPPSGDGGGGRLSERKSEDVSRTSSFARARTSAATATAGPSAVTPIPSRGRSSATPGTGATPGTSTGVSTDSSPILSAADAAARNGTTPEMSAPSMPLSFPLQQPTMTSMSAPELYVVSGVGRQPQRVSALVASSPSDPSFPATLPSSTEYPPAPASVAAPGAVAKAPTTADSLSATAMDRGGTSLSSESARSGTPRQTARPPLVEQVISGSCDDDGRTPTPPSITLPDFDPYPFLTGPGGAPFVQVSDPEINLSSASELERTPSSSTAASGSRPGSHSAGSDSFVERAGGGGGGTLVLESQSRGGQCGGSADDPLAAYYDYHHMPNRPWVGLPVSSVASQGEAFEPPSSGERGRGGSGAAGADSASSNSNSSSSEDLMEWEDPRPSASGRRRRSRFPNAGSGIESEELDGEEIDPGSQMDVVVVVAGVAAPVAVAAEEARPLGTLARTRETGAWWQMTTRRQVSDGDGASIPRESDEDRDAAAAGGTGREEDEEEGDEPASGETVAELPGGVAEESGQRRQDERMAGELAFGGGGAESSSTSTSDDEAEHRLWLQYPDPSLPRRQGVDASDSPLSPESIEPAFGLLGNMDSAHAHGPSLEGRSPSEGGLMAIREESGSHYDDTDGESPTKPRSRRGTGTSSRPGSGDSHA